MADKTKTIIMQLVGGKARKVTVPNEYKITFGSVTIGAKAMSGMSGDRGVAYDGRLGWCLRIYRAKEDPVAIFTDVVSWQLEDVAVQERVTKTMRKKMGKSGPAGYKDATVEARVTKWVDPNNPEGDDDDAAEFVALASGEGDL